MSSCPTTFWIPVAEPSTNWIEANCLGTIAPITPGVTHALMNDLACLMNDTVFTMNS